MSQPLQDETHNTNFGSDTIQHVRIDAIQIGQRFRRDFGDLDGLAASIERGGDSMYPIVLTPDLRLVDGERRLRAYRDVLKRETVPARVVNVGSILDGQIDANTLSKDYTVSERVAIVEALHTFKHGGDRRSDQVLVRDDGTLTVDGAAKRAGFGGKDDFYRAKAVIKKGVPELVEAMDRNRISISAAAELAALGQDEQKSLLAEKSDWTVREIAERRGPVRERRGVRVPLNGHTAGPNGDGHEPVDHRLKSVEKHVARELGVAGATDTAAADGDVVSLGLGDGTGLDDRAVLRAAKEIRQQKRAERNRRQTVLEEAARSELNGRQTWTITGDQTFVPCDLLIADPPQGILTDIDWDNPPEGIEAYTRDWCGRWSACGADFIAVFWCQGRLWEGKRWFDEALTGYEFQQQAVWVAINNCGPKDRKWLKQTWVPILIYRRTGSDKEIVKEGKDWSGDLHNMDCHVAALPQTVYSGHDLKQHPCQKPVSVMTWLINALSDPGERVGSVFCGVSPCGIASTQLGRKYHGVEIDPEYRQIAEGRIAAYGHTSES